MALDSSTILRILGDLAHLRQAVDALLANKPETWLTSKQVCARYNISTRTLAEYRARKRVPYSQVGSKVLYKQSEIEEFLDKHTIRARANK